MALVSDGGTIFTAPFTATNVSHPVFTMFCWVKYPTTVTAAQSFLSFTNTAHNNVSLLHSGSGNANSATWNDDSTNGRTASEAGFTPQANTWVPLCGLFSFTAATTTLVTLRATNTNTVVTGTLGVSAWNQVQVMARTLGGAAASAFQNTGGMLAELAIWSGLLSSTDYNALLFNQLSPWRVRQSDLIMYAPMRMSLVDYGPFHLPFTSSGTLGAKFTGDHPIPAQVTYDSRLWMFTPSSAIINHLALSASGAYVSRLVRQPALLRGAVDAQSLGLVRFNARRFSAASSDIANLLRQITHGSAAQSADAAALARQYTATRSLSGSNAEAAALRRQMALLRGATDAQAAAIASRALLSRAFSATDSEATTLARTAGLLRGVVDTQIAAVRRFVARLFSASEAESASIVRNFGVIRSASDPQSTALIRSIGLIRGAVSTQLAAMLERLVYFRVLFASTTETGALARRSAKILGAVGPQASIVARLVSLIRSTLDAQVAALTRPALFLRSLIVGQAESASEFASTLRHKAVSAFDAQAAALVEAFIHAGTNTGRAMSAISTQVAALSRASSKLLGTGSAQGWSVARLVAHRLPLGSTASTTASLLRQSSKALSYVVAAVTALGRTIGVARSGTNAYAASLQMLKSKLVAASATQTQVAALLRITARNIILTAAATNVAAVLRAASLRRAASNTQVTARKISVARIFAGATPDVAGLQQTRFKSIVALLVQAQVAAVNARLVIIHTHSILASAATAGVAALFHARPRSFAAISRSAVDLVRWPHQFLPLLLRSRVVRLPFAWADVVLPRVSRTVLLPASSAASTLAVMVRRVLLPLEEEDVLNSQISRPEPDRFSPFDPTDEDQFTFDWSRRAYPNDTIIFASITSVPAGVSFLGPAFIDGLLIEITVGPFNPPTLPMTYKLRCTAVFASGRVSNYSVPFVVMNL